MVEGAPAIRVAVPAALAGERIDRVVSLLTGVPRSAAGAIVDEGRIRLGGRTVDSRSRKVGEGDDLEITMPPPAHGPTGDAAVTVDVVYADEQVIVVDKPAGLVVHPGAGNATGTMVQGLLSRFPDLAGQAWPDASRPGIVHRLDKGTSGLLMVARRPEALVSLSAQLQARSVERRYLALVWGVVESGLGVVDAPIGRSVSDPTRMAVRADGRQAVTRYEVITQFASPRPAALVRCTLETGRTHQIRVHLAAIGHPVVGDDRYVHQEVSGPGRRPRRRGNVGSGVGVSRPFLHAAVIGFDHPTSGERLRFESELPADLAAALAQLSL